MSRILIAGVAEAPLLKQSLQEHQLYLADTMQAALKKLHKENFDLIVISIHFDESRMFELMRAITKSKRNSTSPIICFCAHETKMTTAMRGTLELMAEVLGAWMYVDGSFLVNSPTYKRVQTVIQRFFSYTECNEFEQRRLASMKQRERLDVLRRIELEAEEACDKTILSLCRTA